MERSSVPVAVYDRIPGVPPITVFRVGAGGELPTRELLARPHTHDFMVLLYVVRGRGSFHKEGREWPLAPGDLFLIAPGEVIDPGTADTYADVDVWIALFPPDVVASDAFLSWRSHPLLFPFVRGLGGGAQRVPVPVADRARITDRYAALHTELRERRDGYHEATLAHLTLLLVDVSRLAGDVVDGMVLRDEPVLAAVFDTIESRFAEPISLSDVAADVGLTAGHLTTLVGRKTGRTVQQWITERRLAEARKLLAGTDLTVATVARRVGYRDTGYFIRRFRSAHGITPLEWRTAGRPSTASAGR
ncbi:AraC family transcriptional regulator [Actinomycetes bacterium KLBMP 9759]